MKKKWLTRLAAAALTAGLCLGSAGAAFTDVKPNEWYYDAVARCEANGLMNGYEDGSFRPKATVTRAQCATVLKRILPEDNYTWYTEGLVDVPDTEWYADAVTSIGLAMGGITLRDADGVQYPDTWFYPKQACRRENFAMGLYYVLELDYADNWSYHFNDSNRFSPTETCYNYAQAGRAVGQIGVMVGDANGNFNPQKEITRAEVAQILCNYIENYE